MNEAADDLPNNSSRSGTITQFAVKALIVAVVISASTIYVSDRIIDSVELSIARSLLSAQRELQGAQIGGSQFWGKIERELEQAAEPASDLPAEKKQKIINNLRVIVARWRPFLDVLTTEIQKPAP